MKDGNIVLVIENSSTFISGRLDSEIYKQLKELLGYRPKDSIFKIMKSNKHWDGLVTSVCYNRKYCKCYLKKDGVHFPTGCVSKVMSFFKNKDIKYKIIDNRRSVDPNLNLEMSPAFELRDYQQEVLEKVVRSQRGIIKAATGSGKTAIIAGIISKLNISPTIVYVPSQDLLSQMKSEIELFIQDSGGEIEVGVIGDGKCIIKDINVMTIQTAVKSLGKKYKSFDDEERSKNEKLIERREDIKKLIMDTGLILCDEVQHWRSDTCQIISDASINAYYKYGLSATPFRDEDDDILIEGCFGKVIHDINASFLINHPKRYLVKPTIYFIKVNNMKDCEYSSYSKIYQHCLVENDYRNNLIANMATKSYLSGRKVLILCKFVSHGKLLEDMIDDSIFLNGSHSSKERKKHLDKIRNGEPSVTIATSIFDEGVNVKPLDTLILAGSGKSSTRALQRIGRVIRNHDNKGDVVVVDFFDDCKYLKQHSRRRRQIYATEPAFKIIDHE